MPAVSKCRLIGRRLGDSVRQSQQTLVTDDRRPSGHRALGAEGHWHEVQVAAFLRQSVLANEANSAELAMRIICDDEKRVVELLAERYSGWRAINAHLVSAERPIERELLPGHTLMQRGIGDRAGARQRRRAAHYGRLSVENNRCEVHASPSWRPWDTGQCCHAAFPTRFHCDLDLISRRTKYPFETGDGNGSLGTDRWRLIGPIDAHLSGRRLCPAQVDESRVLARSRDELPEFGQCRRRTDRRGYRSGNELAALRLDDCEHAVNNVAAGGAVDILKAQKILWVSSHGELGEIGPGTSKGDRYPLHVNSTYARRDLPMAKDRAPILTDYDIFRWRHHTSNGEQPGLSRPSILLAHTFVDPDCVVSDSSDERSGVDRGDPERDGQQPFVRRIGLVAFGRDDAKNSEGRVRYRCEPGDLDAVILHGQRCRSRRGHLRWFVRREACRRWLVYSLLAGWVAVAQPSKPRGRTAARGDVLT